MTIMTNFPRAASPLPPAPRVTGALTPAQTQAGDAAVPPSADPLAKDANKEMFLKLLVAQIRNQNPLSPIDSVQFVGQLAQFTEIEQMMAIRQDISAVRMDLEKGGTPATQPGSTEKP